ncbi:aminotransferase class I/II-fold pyridoxal phosphate-dependent enzyme [Jannaschia aquimarina]|uniref:Aminotransferase n=1 Tax=Jannaschia aquimarina TaxID=935700 RepID=A0A0D1EFK8_9RHOB|nr:aminotransferase class I/II-fold pyridoxal phosphate-dependent enzyme [Jannaschia aquimarina]KIT16439.1 Threonine-phosphate decarboxylase [Jannaschia aquimarina]SNS92364.1 L-threonine O-3-phosphate decarboxylase [Jannaschia aquimarina]
MTEPSGGREHGGGLDAAIDRWGGTRDAWIDLSTGINPVPYPISDLDPYCWTALPDRAAHDRLVRAAREFWDVPSEAEILPTPGASALIARLPGLIPGPGEFVVDPHSYGEWRAAFLASGWQPHVATQHDAGIPHAEVSVHPDNPTGIYAPGPDRASFGPASCTDGPYEGFTAIYDESFADCVDPKDSLVWTTRSPAFVVVKSFGKFWGLAGLRLGFLIGSPGLVARMAEALGPWPVSGPALAIGAAALEDRAWAEETRTRLVRDAARLDDLMCGAGMHREVLGTPLFRTYTVPGFGAAADWQERLARQRIWSRTFSHSPALLRLGLPDPDDWSRLETALAA